jgi:hypothetical protein
MENGIDQCRRGREMLGGDAKRVLVGRHVVHVHSHEGVRPDRLKKPRDVL